MLIPRVIPCLLLLDGTMVKTIQFKKPNYLGDPVNVINLFNRFEVDEIVLLDIRATVEGRSPDFDLIKRLAEECWVPLTYGGGVSSPEHVECILQAGVEKVVINSAASLRPGLVSDCSKVFGAQSIVVGIDVRRKLLSGYEVMIQSGERGLGCRPEEQARRMADLGAGEIFLNAIDRDGMMEGYDLRLISSVSKAIDIPLIACGGAGVRDDLPLPIVRAGASAVAAGSLFVFRGRERGVLINFPERSELERLFSHGEAE